MHSSALARFPRYALVAQLTLALLPTKQLDEPPAGLSGRERTDLMRLIQRLHAKDIAVLLIEHDIDFVLAISDRIYVLERGKSVLSGPSEVLIQDPQVQQAFLGSSSLAA